MMMMISNTQQSKGVGEGQQKRWLLLLLLQLVARGLEHIGDVLSSCEVMIRMTQQQQQQIIIYSLLFDGRPPLDEDTHNNQPKTAVIMEDGEAVWQSGRWKSDDMIWVLIWV